MWKRADLTNFEGPQSLSRQPEIESGISRTRSRMCEHLKVISGQKFIPQDEVKITHYIRADHRLNLIRACCGELNFHSN
jgi:hypothetical protein